MCEESQWWFFLESCYAIAGLTPERRPRKNALHNEDSNSFVTSANRRGSYAACEWIPAPGGICGGVVSQHDDRQYLVITICRGSVLGSRRRAGGDMDLLASAVTCQEEAMDHENTRSSPG